MKAHELKEHPDKACNILVDMNKITEPIFFK
jgi:hypothetical protein